MYQDSYLADTTRGKLVETHNENNAFFVSKNCYLFPMNPFLFQWPFYLPSITTKPWTARYFIIDTFEKSFTTVHFHKGFINSICISFNYLIFSSYVSRFDKHLHWHIKKLRSTIIFNNSIPGIILCPVDNAIASAKQLNAYSLLPFMCKTHSLCLCICNPHSLIPWYLKISFTYVYVSANLIHLFLRICKPHSLISVCLQTSFTTYKPIDYSMVNLNLFTITHLGDESQRSFNGIIDCSL